MPQTITFQGAARTVTGSRHVLGHEGKNVLVDCGLFQGKAETRERNWDPFSVLPKEIESVILTHAHTDHIGLLPKLRSKGYQGPVYATPGTISIARLSLRDGGRIQEEDAAYRAKKGLPHPEPLFTEDDARAALKLLKPLRYFEWQELPGGAQFRYMPAGHILGSAMAEIYFANGERILMSGDLGRYGRPIIKDPHQAEFAEYLVLESTYGNRLHKEEDVSSILERLMKQAAERGSAIIVPSFSIGRTQELLWHINSLRREGRMPRMPVFVDSPMASAATLLYADHEEDHDKEFQMDMSAGHSPFDADIVHFVRDRGHSKALNNARGPMMVIAGSGMLTGGRAPHHLKHRISDPDTIVLFTGYQAAGTPGRRLIEGADRIYLAGAEVPVEAQIEKLNSLSAHADQAEIMRWLRGFKDAPRKTFLVHGDEEPMQALHDKITQELGWQVEMPSQGDSFEL